jgi:hypothetical protein
MAAFEPPYKLKIFDKNPGGQFPGGGFNTLSKMDFFFLVFDFGGRWSASKMKTLFIFLFP